MFFLKTARSLKKKLTIRSITHDLQPVVLYLKSRNRVSGNPLLQLIFTTMLATTLNMVDENTQLFSLPFVISFAASNTRGFTPLGTARQRPETNRAHTSDNRQHLGQSGRWPVATNRAAMCRLPAGGCKPTPNVSFPTWRTHTPDPYLPVEASIVQWQVLE